MLNSIGIYDNLGIDTKSSNINTSHIEKVLEKRKQFTVTEQLNILKRVKNNAKLLKTQAGRLALYY